MKDTWRIVSNVVFLPVVIVGGLTPSSTMNNFKIVLVKSYLLITFDIFDPYCKQIVFKYVNQLSDPSFENLDLMYPLLWNFMCIVC